MAVNVIVRNELVQEGFLRRESELPPAQVKAHAELDRAVDLCYRPQPFDNDRQRVEHLFALYEKLTAPLLPSGKKSRKRSSPD
jgi:MmeI, C-terminal domain